LISGREAGFAHHQWMKSWNLTPGDKAFNQLAI
jgi:hypothetical protein